MTLSIAFCGPNVELCNKLADATRDLLYSPDLEIAMIGSPIREVSEITQQTQWQSGDLDRINWWSSSLRSMALVRANTAPILISTTCCIDQVAVQASWLADQMGMANNSVALPKGSSEEESRTATINMSGAVLQVLLNCAEHEAMEIFDYVYAVLPVATGVSAAPDAVLTQYADFLIATPAFRSVQRLPDNETSALDVLRTEVGLWRKTLAS